MNANNKKRLFLNNGETSRIFEIPTISEPVYHKTMTFSIDPRTKKEYRAHEYHLTDKGNGKDYAFLPNEELRSIIPIRNYKYHGRGQILFPNSQICYWYQGEQIVDPKSIAYLDTCEKKELNKALEICAAKEGIKIVPISSQKFVAEIHSGRERES